MAFLPATAAEMKELGWERPDFVLVTGDAYVDHPSFGHAIISRVLESHGYRVAILAQPDYKSVDDFRTFGRPRLGFLINSGNVDSMVSHYSVFKKRRREDKYSPGGIPGRRPDRAVTVYSSRAREAYKDVPIIIGGLEASLRRFAHYDYWEDKVRRSVILDAKADLLIFGMGEKPVVEIAEALDSGISIRDIRWIRGTVYKTTGTDVGELRREAPDMLMLPSFSDICASKPAFAESFRLQYQNNDPISGRTLAEAYGDGLMVVQNPPAGILSQQELDDVYALPYEGAWHPMYNEIGGVPALEEVRFSITANRGCFGGCSFCALAFHQGKMVQGRSRESIVEEAERLTRRADFKGYIHDVGGPTANFRRAACARQLTSGVCRDRDCLYPKPCPNLDIDHSEYLDILREVRNLPGVKKVFIRSGIRFDYAIYDKNPDFIEELCRHYVSGSLKIAPEHVSPKVLAKMRKPSKDVFLKFSDKYNKINRQLGKKQYLIPYFISSHPGSGLKEAVELAVFLKEIGFVPDQVQDFYPTPGTLSTCMYYTEIDPMTGEPVHVAKDIEEKRMQRALLHFNKPENRELVIKALIAAGRPDLIGSGPHALIGSERRNRDEPDFKAASGNRKKQGGIPSNKERRKRSRASDDRDSRRRR